jgi:hypothetical protein
MDPWAIPWHCRNERRRKNDGIATGPQTSHHQDHRQAQHEGLGSGDGGESYRTVPKFDATFGEQTHLIVMIQSSYILFTSRVKQTVCEIIIDKS